MFRIPLGRALALGASALVAWAPAVASAAPALSHAVRVAIVSDPHTNRDTTEDHPLFRARVDKVIAAVNTAKVAFVLVTGDLTQGGKPVEFEDFKAQVKQFHAPVFWVPGNHDAGNKKLPPRDPGPTEEQLARCERELGPTYYAKDVAGVHLVAVNSQLLGSGLREEPDEWKFLEEQFAQPVPQPTLVFMHVPPFLNSADEPGGIYWNLEPAPRARFLALLERGGVHTVLDGHLHRPLVNHHDGIVFITTTSAAWGIPRGVTPEGWTLLTVEPNGDVHAEFKTIKE